MSPYCLGNLFLHLKTVEIHVHGVPSLVHSALQNNWILEGESCEIRILSRWIQKTCTLSKVKNPGFTFSIELKINYKIFKVISWSVNMKQGMCFLKLPAIYNFSRCVQNKLSIFSPTNLNYVRSCDLIMLMFLFTRAPTFGFVATVLLSFGPKRESTRSNLYLHKTLIN